MFIKLLCPQGRALGDLDPSIHGARYTITRASAEDAGMYKCTAKNDQRQMPDERTIEVQVHCKYCIAMHYDSLLALGQGVQFLFLYVQLLSLCYIG